MRKESPQKPRYHSCSLFFFLCAVGFILFSAACLSLLLSRASENDHPQFLSILGQIELGFFFLIPILNSWERESYRLSLGQCLPLGHVGVVGREEPGKNVAVAGPSLRVVGAPQGERRIANWPDIPLQLEDEESQSALRVGMIWTMKLKPSS